MSALIFALSVLALMPAFASPWVSCSAVLRMRPAMVAKAVSTSLVETSRPHRLASYLQPFVNELLEDLLARRRLVGGQLSELAALLDVECRDRVAVDDDDDLLGACNGRGRSQRDQPGCQEPAGSDQDVDHVYHRFVRFAVLARGVAESVVEHGGVHAGRFPPRVRRLICIINVRLTETLPL